MIRLSHEQRAERREQVIAMVGDGHTHAAVAKHFGISRVYVTRICGGIVMSRSRVVAARRIAALRELATLGITRRRAAALLRMWPNTLSAVCKKHQIVGFHYDKAGWEPVISAAKDRAETMAALYRDGYTLEQIGAQFGVTRERVRQVLGKYKRMAGGDGGQHVRAERLRLKRLAAKDAKYLRTHGCTFEQWQSLRDLGEKMRAEGRGVYQTPLRAFINQRNNARRRKIGWELTLWQWWGIWQSSGHWEHRGLRAGQYVMCRNGDVGPYAVGNVFIALSVENVSQGNRRKNADLPIGVSPTKSGKFKAARAVNGRKLWLGTFATPELAYAAYLRAAEPMREAA